MSIETSRWAWTVPDLSPTQKLVLLHLADRANPANLAWPSIKGISLDTGLGRASVTRCLAVLRDRALIYPVGYGGKTGQAVIYLLAGRARKKERGPGFEEWDPERERWAHSDLPVGSERDGGVLTVSLPRAQSEPHNLSDNQSVTDHQPAARLQASARPGGDQLLKRVPPIEFFNLKKEMMQCKT